MILSELGRGERLEVTPNRLIVAGYTGRDEAAVAEHIAELAAIGVPPPPSVPAFYELDPALVTTSDAIDVAGPHTSGEVEPVLIRHDGEYLLAVGSDHTDRDLERVDIADAKAACPKPVGADVISLGAAPDVDWTALTVQSSVDGRPYQRGGVGTLRHPSDLLGRMTRTLGEVSGDFVLFCGTMPLLVGEFVYGQSWRVELTLPDEQRLCHDYRLKSVA
jgi:Protein of unknown function (DUF2848)